MGKGHPDEHGPESVCENLAARPDDLRYWTLRGTKRTGAKRASIGAMCSEMGRGRGSGGTDPHDVALKL